MSVEPEIEPLARHEPDVGERWALLEAALFPRDERLAAMVA